MYISEEAWDAYQEKISEAIRNREWEDAMFIISTVLSPKNSYSSDCYMGVFIYRVCSYFESQYSHHPERVESLPELAEQWVEKQGGSFNRWELAGYYTALACMFRKKNDREKEKIYYEKAEMYADKEIEESGTCTAYERKAYLYLRFQKYDKIPELLKRMKLLAVDEYDEESCERIEECYKEKYCYGYSFS